MSFLGDFIERRSQAVSLPHAGHFEGPMKMVEPALASHTGCWHGFRTSWMTQRRGREYTKQYNALHYLRVFLAGVVGDELCSPTYTCRIARYQQFGFIFLLWRNDGVQGR